MTKEEILAQITDATPEDALDEAVHDLKGQEAAEINNGGFESQLDYLLESGMTEQQILDIISGK